MGVHVWQRDSAGGHTFATAAPAPQPRPGNKRKLVWTRQDGAAGAAQAAAPGAAQASPFVGAGRQGSGGAGPAQGALQPCKRARGAPSDISATEHAAEAEQERSQVAGGADWRAGGATVRAGPECDGQPDGAAPRPASLRGAAAGVAAGDAARPGGGRGRAGGAMPGRASLRAGDAGGPGGPLEGAQQAGRRGGAAEGRAHGPAAQRGGATGGPRRSAGAAAQAEPHGQEANGHARESVPRAGPAGGSGQAAGAAAQGGPGGERVNGSAPGPAGLRAQAAELAMLRRTVAQRQRQLAQERVEAARRTAAAAAAEQHREQDLARRRERLRAGFAEAFREADALVAAELAEERGAAASGADTREVARVLAAAGDYEVLQLKPGAGAAALRRRYREMAVALHPDKCKAAGATDAFQRMVQAYQNLLRFV